MSRALDFAAFCCFCDGQVAHLLAEDAYEAFDHKVRRHAYEDDEEDRILPLRVLARLSVRATDIHRRKQRVAPVVQCTELKEGQHCLHVQKLVANQVLQQSRAVIPPQLPVQGSAGCLAKLSKHVAKSQPTVFEVRF